MRCRITVLVFLVLFVGYLCLWSLLSDSARTLNPDIDLLTVTVAELQTLLAEGAVSSEELIRQYVARIENDNRRGLQLRAVLEVAPYGDLLEQARRYDRERTGGRIRGPLHGIPILIKDNIATDPALGMRTTAGSFALCIHLSLCVSELIAVDSVVPRDATIVERLRKAGAIILGKTNLSEFANFRSLNNTNGWSAVGGQTQSAYVVGGYCLRQKTIDSVELRLAVIHAAAALEAR